VSEVGNRRLTRRGLLATATLVPLIGCARGVTGSHATSTTGVAGADVAHRFAELERKYHARLGVCVLADGESAKIAYRADERFAFCSTFKVPLVAAVLHKSPLARLNTMIRFTTADILSTSPITEQHVKTGMTIGQLCDAAIRFSDGTAANLLLADLGGPTAFTGYLRSLGDTVSRLDQKEPELNRVPPADKQDTTTPRAISIVYQLLVVGGGLRPAERALLADWMARNTTGGKRIRAGFPSNWQVMDKTGSGDYGRANDVAVVWSPRDVPYVIAIMSDRAGGGYNAEPSDALVADAAVCVAEVLG
jgi:beta-lactamase class A